MTLFYFSIRYSVSHVGPYTSHKKFLAAFDSIEFRGGMGDLYTSGQEGLAMALRIFDDLKQKRASNPQVKQEPSKFIIYMSNSTNFDMPVMDVPPYAGQSMDQILKTIVARNIKMSLICPRKFPYLIKLFEKAGGDLAAAR